MEFEINETTWTIELVDETRMKAETDNNYTIGLTIYKPQKVLLLKEHKNIIRTLKHELMHVWLYEYEHSQDDDFSYNYEDVCEIVASSNIFINKTVEAFKMFADQERTGKHS